MSGSVRVAIATVMQIRCADREVARCTLDRAAWAKLASQALDDGLGAATAGRQAPG